HHRVQLEFDALSARWDVARAQLAEAEQALKSSQATIKAAQRLSSSVEWRTVLDGVLDAASELVRFERGTLALVDHLQEELKVEAARNSPIAISEMSRFKVGEGIAGWALSHREPVLVRDSRSDSRFKASDPKHQPRSFIAVPLLADKEGLGVLTLARAATDPFTEHDLRNLARVATDAANALINARLVDLLKQREDRLTTLVRKARELSVANDSKQLVEFVLSSAKELIGGNAALLALRNPKSLELEVAGSQGVAEVIISQRIAWGAPAAGDVMRTGKPWVSLMREMLPPNLVETVETAGLSMIASVLCGSLREQDATDDGALLSRSEVEVSDEVSGVLNVYRDNLDPIPAGDLEQLKAFAEQASVAIQNVRRWDRVKEQLQATASMNPRKRGRSPSRAFARKRRLDGASARFKSLNWLCFGAAVMSSRNGALAADASSALAGEIEPAEYERVEDAVRGDDAVGDATRAFAPVGLEVDQVFLLLSPDQLDQLAEVGVIVDRNPFFLDALLDGHREGLGLGEVQPLQRLQQVVEPSEVIATLRFIAVCAR
ncbi:MAG: GAF domain-containing protein, partial [Chloroflexi bacterium]